MASFSVHVTNAVYGKAAEGVPVRCYQWLDNGWVEGSLDRTDVDGRVTVQLDMNVETLARFEVDTDYYFATLGVKPVHPVITLTLRTRQPSDFRVRLLVAPSAYVMSVEV